MAGKKTASVVDLSSLDVPMSISFDVEVRNDTKAQIKFKDLAYDFYINESKVFGGTTGSVVNEGKRSLIRVPIPSARKCWVVSR